MNDDVEKLLSDLGPRGAPPELRDQTLKRVADALAGEATSGATAGLSSSAENPFEQPARGARRRTAWDSRLAWGVAAALLLGVVLNVAVFRIGDARLAAYDPSEPEPLSISQIATAIAQGDDGFDHWENRLLAARWSRRAQPSENAFRRYQDILNQTLSIAKELTHEVSEKAAEVDIHHPRQFGGGHTGCQRLFRVDHRFTA
ncbi:MAG: hypothetical protein JW888_00625 [Pirellulales bacterium]|nr:hypothetical protein [Pirellulales bacterium]